VTFTITVRSLEGETLVFTQIQSLTIAKEGEIGDDGVDAISTFYSNQAHTVPVTTEGVETWTGSGGILQLYDGATALILDSNTQSAQFPVGNGRYRVNITQEYGNTLTEPNITGQGTAIATLGNWAGDLTTVTVYRLSIYVRNSAGETFTPIFDITLTPSFQGDRGLDGAYSGIIVIRKSGTAAPTLQDLSNLELDPSSIKVGTYAVVYDINDNNAQGYRVTVAGASPTWVAAKTVYSEVIAANAITANQLQISSDSQNNAVNGVDGKRMFFNGTDNRIQIYDTSGNLRVVLGNLSGI
jgi:hypothetical protein